MLLPETQLESQFRHYLILEMTSMVSDNLFTNTEPGNSLIEEKQGRCVTVILESRYSLNPLSKLVYGHDDILLISYRRQITTSKINAQLCERTNGDHKEKQSSMCVHFPSINLTRMASIHHFNTIFEDEGQK